MMVSVDVAAPHCWRYSGSLGRPSVLRICKSGHEGGCAHTTTVTFQSTVELLVAD